MSDSLWPHIAHQALLSMGFSRQEYWSGLPFPSPGIFPTQASKPSLLHLLRRKWVLYHCATWEAPETQCNCEPEREMTRWTVGRFYHSIYPWAVSILTALKNWMANINLVKNRKVHVATVKWRLTGADELNRVFLESFLLSPWKSLLISPEKP